MHTISKIYLLGLATFLACSFDKSELAGPPVGGVDAGENPTDAPAGNPGTGGSSDGDVGSVSPSSGGAGGVIPGDAMPPDGFVGVGGATASGGSIGTGGTVGIGGVAVAGGQTGAGGVTSLGGTPIGGTSLGGITTALGGTIFSGGAIGSTGSTATLPGSGLAVWTDRITGDGYFTFNLRIDNLTSLPSDVSTVTMRYWYQEESLGTSVILSSNYVSIGVTKEGKVTDARVVSSASGAGADHYLEFTLAGTLSARGAGDSTDKFTIKVSVHTASWTGKVDVTNDYSYNAGATGYNDKITLHSGDKVIWGAPPGPAIVPTGGIGGTSGSPTTRTGGVAGTGGRAGAEGISSSATRCTGTALSCSSCSPYSCSCPGCTLGTCSGTAYSCSLCESYTSSCGLCPGCTITSGCTGTATPCGNYADSLDCLNQVGCTWAASSSKCQGTATPCATVGTINCSLQGGCHMSTCVGTPTVCTSITNPTTCAKNPGCVWSGGQV